MSDEEGDFEIAEEVPVSEGNCTIGGVDIELNP
jgi:hypothetical protein